MNTVFRIVEAYKRIAFKYILFGHITRRLKFIEKPEVGTMAVDGTKLTLHFNSEFVKGLTDDQLDTLCLHELFHIIFDHSRRHVKKFNHLINNIAMDLEINSVLKEKLNCDFSKLDGLLPEKFKYPPLRTMEYYLELVSKDSKDIQFGQPLDNCIDSSESGDGESNSNNSSDKGNSNGDSSKESDKDNKGDKDKKDSNKDSKSKKNDPIDNLEVRKAINEVLNNLDNKDGNSSADGNQDGDDGDGAGTSSNFSEGTLVGNKSMTFYELIHKLVKKSIKLNTEYSYSKLSRRNCNEIIHPGVLKSEVVNIDLAIVVDISGSVSSYIDSMVKSLIEFRNKFNKIYKSKYLLRADLYFTNTRVVRIIPIEKLDKHYPVGGGTYMYAGFDAIVKSNHKYNNIVIFTDGEDNVNDYPSRSSFYPLNIALTPGSDYSCYNDDVRFKTTKIKFTN